MDFAQEGHFFAGAFMGGNRSEDYAYKNEDCKKRREDEERENETNDGKDEEYKCLVEVEANELISSVAYGNAHDDTDDARPVHRHGKRSLVSVCRVDDFLLVGLLVTGLLITRLLIAGLLVSLLLILPLRCLRGSCLRLGLSLGLLSLLLWSLGSSCLSLGLGLLSLLLWSLGCWRLFLGCSLGLLICGSLLRRLILRHCLLNYSCAACGAKLCSFAYGSTALCAIHFPLLQRMFHVSAIAVCIIASIACVRNSANYADALTGLHEGIKKAR